MKMGVFKEFASLATAALVAGAAACARDAGPLEEDVGTVSAAVRPAPDVDARRSLAVTDVPILARFSLRRVLDRLVATSAASNVSSSDLFQQWWDVFNPAPGIGRGPHCDDARGDEGQPLLNGFPYSCRAQPAEGYQASCDPFAEASPCAYVPVGLFMRFDLAPSDGSHCGEYRVVFAKETGRTDPNDRSLVIFEAAMRNPHFNQGIRGCEKLVRAWAELSNEPDVDVRADVLESIYFDGYKEFDPVIQYANFGDNAFGAGQVRTNQFVQPTAPRVWSLREFKLRRECAGACALRFVPVTVKTNPFGPLFDGAWSDPRATAFQGGFPGLVSGLAASSLDGIGMHVDDVFNSGQSQAAGAVSETNYVTQFGVAPSPFRASIQDELTRIGSALTPDEVVKRAQAMSCAGCHRFSNGVNLGGGLTWPPSLGFTHVSERDVDVETEAGTGVRRYKLSPALVASFLPHRKRLVEDFLNDAPRPAKPPTTPLGGRFTH